MSSVHTSRIGQRVFLEACSFSCNPNSAAKGQDVEDPTTQHHHVKPQCIILTETLPVANPDWLHESLSIPFAVQSISSVGFVCKSGVLCTLRGDGKAKGFPSSLICQQPFSAPCSQSCQPGSGLHFTCNLGQSNLEKAFS